MGNDTGIEWTDRTWNPMRGCSRVSPGCQNCYAERVANRFSGKGKPFEGFIKQVGKSGPSKGRWSGVVRVVDDHLHDPLAWRQPSKIFVNSMSDLFHEKFSVMDIAAVFGVMACADRHTFQFLTKRPHEMRHFYRSVAINPSAIIDHAWTRLRNMRQYAWADYVGQRFMKRRDDGWAETVMPWPLPNVWAGVSVENREHGVPRIDELRKIPAAVRFLSIEPLLEDLGELDLSGIHWAIIGCESGPGARPCQVEWVRPIIRQCQEQNVAVFVKQLMRDDREDEYGQPFVHAMHADVKDGPTTSAYKGKLVSLPFVDGKQYVNFPTV